MAQDVEQCAGPSETLNVAKDRMANAPIAYQLMLVSKALHALLQGAQTAVHPLPLLCLSPDGCTDHLLCVGLYCCRSDAAGYAHHQLGQALTFAGGHERHTMPWGESLLQGERAANMSERDRAKAAVLEEAQIVCSTLSFSGSRSFAQMKRKFDVVVIDEAAQAVEPSVLIPICQGVKQVRWGSSEGCIWQCRT